MLPLMLSNIPAQGPKGSKERSTTWLDVSTDAGAGVADGRLSQTTHLP